VMEEDSAITDIVNIHVKNVNQKRLSKKPKKKPRAKPRWRLRVTKN
jgi:hypothetical protein